MVMFGNYWVSQSHLSTVAPQNLKMLESTNSPISEEIASEVQANGVKSPTPARVHAEAEWSEEAELAPGLAKLATGIIKRESGVASTFAHPLSSHEESMTGGIDVDTRLASGCVTDFTGSSEQDAAAVGSSDLGTSLLGTCPPMPLNSADLNPLTHGHLKRCNTSDVASGSIRKVQAHSNTDSDQDQTLLAHSQSPTELPDTCSQNIPTHGKPESDKDELALAESHPATTNEKCASSLCSSSYDFVMWYHDADEQAAKCIYDYLEEGLKLHGFMYSRDKTLGTYELKAMDEAIQSSEKVLLFITPRSKDCGMFEAQMHTSLKHSIQSRRNNVIPIFWELDRSQGPSVVGYIYSLNYCGCSDKFKSQIAKVFVNRSPSSSTSHGTSLCNDKSGQSTESVNSPNLRQSQSVPTPEKKKGLFRRFLSLGK